MNNSAPPVTETLLRTDLCQQAHELIRELALACKKMAIYGPHHPVAARSVAKPYFHLGTLFRFKRYININVQSGQLYILNIRARDNVFSTQLLQFLQVLDLKALVFERAVNDAEFTTFLQRFVIRLSPEDPDHLMSSYLRRKDITTIEANSERAFAMFENGRIYRGEIEDDYSARRMIMDSLSEDITVLSRLGAGDESVFEEAGLDFEPELITYVLPEKIATLPLDSTRRQLSEMAEKQAPQLAEAIDLLRMHPHRDKLFESLQGEVDQFTSAQSGRLPDPSLEDSLEVILSPETTYVTASTILSGFQRLLKGARRSEAQALLDRLTEGLASAHSIVRQRALEIIVAVTDQIDLDTDRSLMEYAIDSAAERLQRREETYEYSEYLWRIFERCLNRQRYDLVRRITTAMTSRRRMSGNVTVYDSIAVKKLFENINQPVVINMMISDLVAHRVGNTADLKKVLVDLGSQEVALALSRIISHSERNVRQQVLKILAGLGKAALDVFSSILDDDAWFERESDRRELPEHRWYVVRNSIFVLGSLGDPAGVHPLRMRISDPDHRVRREIVSALEKIGGEDAVDILIVMADDSDREIRHAAIIAVGLIGGPDCVPLLIDVARRLPSEAVRVVKTIGKLGGSDARAFLLHLLQNDEAVADLADGQVSREELLVGVVQALGEIADPQSLDGLKAYQQRSTALSALFSRSGTIHKAISEVLSRQS